MILAAEQVLVVASHHTDDVFRMRSGCREGEGGENYDDGYDEESHVSAMTLDRSIFDENVDQ